MQVHPPLPIALFFLCGTLHAQQEYHLAPTKDAVVGIHPGYPTAGNNYGSADHFSCTSQPGNMGGENNARSLMAFDLSMIEVGSLLDSARLDLYGRGATDDTGASTSVGNNGVNASFLERITELWTETGVTWNNQPITTQVNAVTLAQSTSVIQDYPGIDVTTLVQDMINNPASSHGFCLRLVIEDITRGMYFCSTDYSNAAKHPTLHVYVKSDVSIPEGRADLLELVISPSLTRIGEPIRVVMDGMSTATSLRVFDAAGHLVREQSAAGPNGMFDTSGLAPAAYRLVLYDGSGRTLGAGRFVLH